MGAAAALGLSVDAVKRRLRSGALKGKKSPAGVWTVYLEGNAETTPEPETSSQPGTRFAEADRVHLELEAERRVNAALTARVDAQERQIEGMLRQLDAAAEERAELRQLLAAALSRASRAIVEGSHAGVPEAERAPAHEPHADARGARRGWAWLPWRRPKVPQGT